MNQAKQGEGGRTECDDLVVDGIGAEFLALHHVDAGDGHAQRRAAEALQAHAARVALVAHLARGEAAARAQVALAAESKP